MDAKSAIRVSKITGMLVVAGAALLLTACATGPVIRTRTAVGANLAGAHTFAFVRRPGTDHGPYKSLTTQQLERDVTRQMQSRGYTRVATDASPDLLVNFHVTLHHRVEGGGGPYWGAGWPPPYGGWGWGGWGWGWPYGYGWGWGGFYNSVYTVTRSALTVSIINRSNRSVVWSGTAVSDVSWGMVNHPGRLIRGAVRQIFAHYPVLAH